jgi:plastocyanin
MRTVHLFVALLGVLFLAGCSGGEEINDPTMTEPEEEVAQDNVPSQEEETNQESENTQDAGSVDETSQESENTSDDVREINLEAFNFGYSQEEITVQQGETVRIVMENTGGNHDFVIDELDVATPVISGGETTNVTFTADETGEFFFYCSVGNHRSAGMEGTLIVE